MVGAVCKNYSKPYEFRIQGKIGNLNVSEMNVVFDK